MDYLKTILGVNILLIVINLILMGVIFNKFSDRREENIPLKHLKEVHECNSQLDEQKQNITFCVQALKNISTENIHLRFKEYLK